jgi:hypothetical protein
MTTSCFPKASLNSDGFTVLKNRFAAYLAANLQGQGISANISSVFAFPLDSKFLVTAQTCAANFSSFDSLSFFDECLCQDSTSGALRSTSHLLEKTIVLHNASCDAFDLDHLERLRLAIADGLSGHGARQADVLYTQIACLPLGSRPRIRISFKVGSATTSQALLSADLSTKVTWQSIYESFLVKLASFTCIVADDFAIEYLPGELIPPDGSGSGSGEL